MRWIYRPSSKIKISIESLYRAVARAQNRASGPEFEVASVKSGAPLLPGEPIRIDLGTARNGRLTLTNATLSDCIKYAYGIVSDQQISGPDWIKAKEVRFDIVAQYPVATPQDQVFLMLRNLLEHRLKLALHHEDRQLSYLALAVGKNGIKFSGAAETSSPNVTALGHVIHSHLSMPLLATLLSRFERELILDKTGLSGFFSLKLEWTPETLRGRGGPDGGSPVMANAAGVDPEGPPLVTALQEQLGLRLESRRGPIEVLIVDHAEKVPGAD